MSKEIDTQTDSDKYRQYNLASLGQVRAFVARIINQSYAGKYPKGKTIPSANQLVGMCNVLKGMITDIDAEKVAERLKDWEDKQNGS